MPMLTSKAIKRVHKVNIPVNCHVGNALSPTQVLIVLAIELSHHQIAGGRRELARVEGIAKVIVPKVLRAMRHPSAHVLLCGTGVIMVQRRVDARCIKLPAVHQEADHRQVCARETPAFLDLAESLANEVLTVVRYLSYVPLTNLLLQHVFLRGNQASRSRVTTTGLGIRPLPWLKLQTQRSRGPAPCTLPKESHKLSTSHATELILELSAGQ